MSFRGHGAQRRDKRRIYGDYRTVSRTPHEERSVERDHSQRVSCILMVLLCCSLHFFIVLMSRREMESESLYTIRRRNRNSDFELPLIIGVHLSPDFKTSTHCAKIAAAASSRSFLVLKSFSSNDATLLIRAYKTYVRPLLESATPVWTPYLKKDITLVEKVQAAFTRKVCLRCGIPFENYSGRLIALNLHSLEYRRIFFDLCMVFKIIHRLVDLPFNCFFSFKDSIYSMRGHSLQLKKTEFPKHQYRQHSFAIRVVNAWNSLPESVISSSSLALFKSALDKVNLSSFCCVYDLGRRFFRKNRKKFLTWGGAEPATFWLRVRCSTNWATQATLSDSSKLLYEPTEHASLIERKTLQPVRVHIRKAGQYGGAGKPHINPNWHQKPNLGRRFFRKNRKKFLSWGGAEPAAFWLRVRCSTNWATQATLSDSSKLL